MKYSVFLIIFILNFVSVFGQKLDKITAIQKELKESYNKFTKSDPSNKGAKLLAGKLGMIDQAIIRYTKDQNASTLQDLSDLTEDLVKESGKYQSANSKELKIKMDKLAAELNLGKKNTVVKDDKKDNNDTKKDNNKEEVADNKPVDDKKEDSKTDEVTGSETLESDTKAENEIVLGENKDYQQNDFKLIVYSLFAVLFLFFIIMWITLRSNINKFSATTKEALKEHDREITSLEKVLINGKMEKGEMQNFKDAYNKKFEALENNTANFLLEIDKKLSSIDIRFETKSDIVQLESLKNHLSNYVSKEQLDIIMSSLNEKLKSIELNSKSTSILNNSITQSISKTQIFEDNIKDLTAVLEDFKRNTQILALRDLIDLHLPLIKFAKSNQDLSSLAMAKLIQLAYVSGYNENLNENYLNLSVILRKEGFEIDDNIVGRLAPSDYNADSVYFEDYLTMTTVRNNEYPNFIAVKQTVENSPYFGTSLNKTVLFTLYPTIYYSANGAKTLLKKGEYIVKGNQF